MSTANGSEPENGRALRLWYRHRLIEPLRSQIGKASPPDSLAWALAVGALIGSMPLAWGTTLLCLGAALLLRLNPLAVQLGNYAAWPLQILLAYPYCRLGAAWFGPFVKRTVDAAPSGTPAHLLRTLAAANSAALGAWALTAPLLLPLLYVAGRRLIAVVGRTKR